MEAFTADYPLDGDYNQIHFRGPFKGRVVVWHARVYTLVGYQRLHPEGPLRERNFIDMSEGGEDEIALEIGLDVERIGRAQILMTIKMIHKFKNLRRGFHEWGMPATGGES